jgi:hypothetical protein
MNIYQLLLDVGGYKKITCLGSLQSDMRYYYGLKLSNDNLQKILDSYNKIYEDFWNDIGKYKNNKRVEETKNLQVKLVNPDNGIYFNMIKVDFEKAFTNYFYLIANDNSKHLFDTHIKKVAVSYLPRRIKKYFYNYMLTNILVNTESNLKLMELRNKVYEELMYISNNYGSIIKSEIDGAYIQTKAKKFPVLEVLGTITIDIIKYVFIKDKLLCIKYKDKSSIKGLNKYGPNIYNKTLQDFLNKSTFKERDDVINDFILDNQIHMLDWGIKSVDGTKLTYHLSNMDVDYNSSTIDDIKDLYKISKLLNKDKYIHTIYPYLKDLFSMTH